MNDETPITRKTVSLPADMWEQIENFQFSNRIKKDSVAIRRLVEIGLGARPVLTEVLDFLERAPEPKDQDQVKAIADLRRLLGLPEAE